MGLKQCASWNPQTLAPNRHGWVSTYVKGTVRKRTADKQQPTFSQSGRSDFVISRVRKHIMRPRAD